MGMYALRLHGKDWLGRIARENDKDFRNSAGRSPSPEGHEQWTSVVEKWWGGTQAIKDEVEKVKADLAIGFVWTGTESNRRHMDFQSIALPSELPVQLSCQVY
jgi:hypothetical protein